MSPADADDTDLSESSSREASSETTPTVGAPSDPLTDAERVRHLLIDNGGRIQQSEIVRQTEWSKSKVSRLLSKMEQENQIMKINIGRKNLITRPGSEPKMADTTTED